MMRKQRIIELGAMILVFVVGVMMGCSTDRDPSELFAPEGVGTPVVHAALIVQERYPRVYLSRAAAPDKAFVLANQVIIGATVTITSSTGFTMPYTEKPTGGVYVPDSQGAIIIANETYTLRVETAEGEIITAKTKTPGTFAIDRWVLLDDAGTTVRRELRSFNELGDSVYFAPENQLVYADGLLEAQFKDLPVPSYQVGIFSLDRDSELVIDPDFLSDDQIADLERDLSSPPLEGDGGSLRLPWFAIYYAERYKLKVFALDQNWFDLVRSVPELGGGVGFGGNTGDNFEKPIFHINGGIGLFGSASVDSTGFFVLPRP